MDGQSLTIVRGCPGAGKSEFALQLIHGKDNTVVLSADNYRKDKGGRYAFDPKKSKADHERCRQECEAYLDRGTSVIVANTFITNAEVAIYEEAAAARNIRFYSVIVEHRHAGRNIHGIPSDIVKEMEKKFDVKLT